MRSKVARFLTMLCLAAPAAAQQVLFTEDFEDGLAGWTPAGMWNAEDASNLCGSWAAPFPSGTGVAYYGNETPCTYNAGPGIPLAASLAWDGWIDLPAGAASISLRFWMTSQSEYCWGGWDLHELWIDVENGPSHLFALCTDWNGDVATVAWHERRIDLTTLGGSRVRPRFHFDSVDGSFDWYRGWFVDDVSISVEPGVRVCPGLGFFTGCPCAPQSSFPLPVAGGCRNSTNQSAVLVSSGAPVVSADTLGITVRNLPPNASCILAQASGSSNAYVFGDGVRCVSGQIRRMGIVAASNGVASWPPPGTDPIALRGLVPAAGGTRYYYVNYRDVLPWCTTATFNLTDAQRIVWVP